LKLALGTAQFGLDYGISNQTGIVQLFEIEKILRKAESHGIDLLDTAQAYGESESRIGITDTNDFRIITKLKPGIVFSEIESSVNSSLVKLHKDRLYGVLFHNFEDFRQDIQTIDALNKCKDRDLIEKIGFSLYYPAELEFLLKQKVDFDLVQIPFNVFDQRFKPYFSDLKSAGIEIHTRSVFLQGLVFLQPHRLSRHFYEYLKLFTTFHEEVNKANLSIASACLGYVCLQDEIDRVIIGVCSEKELLSNIHAVQDTRFKYGNLMNEISKFRIADEKITLPFNWK